MAFINVISSLCLALTYSTCTENKDRGWTIGAWMATVQGLWSLYFHYQNQ